MALSFPLNNAPYGLVAIAAALNAPESTISLKPVPAETSTTTSLIPQGTAKPVKISGQVAIARYLVRSLASNSLYSESDLALVTAQDNLLDIVRQTIATPKHITTLATAANSASTAFLLAQDKPLLADYAVWGAITAYTKSHSLLANLKDLEKFTAWIARMDQRQECKLAIERVDKALKDAQETIAAEATSLAAEKAKLSSVVEVPTIEGSDPDTDPLDAFKNVLAAQLSTLVDVDIKILYDALEAPRASENGHIALSVPRLRLKGAPAAIAADIVAKVSEE
ncbi:hypothetical protein EC957_001511 [Mortierella hygrophila]|uniref:Uncharacterized protein n=1 Tax=Mortierella hygrophila TaxID=979708 RepID=A0A9P6F5L3_9FUNG|nr:hypothetical protein EC957_001511 [Mortierella hygrophila]